ncbi:hypothetical protein [Pollutimonas bauzanensis]|uniref:Uncharacterized protein n=1 Tax=Pollutimonas bauzanensis TaxID=658167 RepID=A0A1M5ZDW9_9BURK|nr:hypothetical protein [Pollutimonas bauzanensis]SHI22420.1 hypothetical protein SAMN04488135_11415 [Pollutimonas bauzanensis]
MSISLQVFGTIAKLSRVNYFGLPVRTNYPGRLMPEGLVRGDDQGASCIDPAFHWKTASALKKSGQ